MKILVVLALFLGLAACKNNKPKKNLGSNRALAALQTKKSVITTQKIFNFENYKTGQLPEDWSQFTTGKDPETKWQIIQDQDNKVLAQLSDKHPNYHFNIAIYNNLSAKNIDLSVRFKAIKGHMDQGGGLVWRFKDPNNYYVVRTNPLEDNVVLYKVENGVRLDLPLVGKGKTYGMNVGKLGQAWNHLRLVTQNELFTVYLNGKKLFEVKDESFKNKGKTGLWTKADAVTYFDDFQIDVLK